MKMATISKLIRYTVQSNKCIRLSQRNRSDACGESQNKDSCGSSESTGSSSGGSSNHPPPSSMARYDCRKFGHNLPMDSVMPNFETLPCIPTGIFRNTFGEILGNGAAKCSYYQNPEYFSFHHMTFYDMHMILRCYRLPSPATGRKK
ncbi:unnamed protein product [Danaus chrysippus]|uniref:(African queen) hypothetical protein n=1 Tax=Danaus chrysippus TaxID=151541 RepID=A0A8J2VW13_9NEOP|nr:unnamed protein product [Danaus chrysippus]